MDIGAVRGQSYSDAKFYPTTDESGAPTLTRGKDIQSGKTIANTSGGMYTGTLPDGRVVAGTPGEMQSSGASGVTKLPAIESGKVVVARQLVAPNGLFHAVAGDIATLDKNGQLGTIASRWNDFVSGKVGTGPEFASLRANMGLLSTALMQAHVGARGSDEMREHFLHLADYRISDAPTLRSALSSEFKYVTEKAAFIPKGGK
jgi:hypothetical protein